MTAPGSLKIPAIPAHSPARRSRDALAAAFGALALKAGAVIMDVYARGCAVKIKGDGSPVSEADERAEAVILEGLAQLMPGCVVIAEEQCAASGIPVAPDEFSLVDPLDGTREFVSRNGEFTVNIAFISHGEPLAGAIFAPVLDRLWLGGDTACVMAAKPGAALPPLGERHAMATRPAARDRLVALASRSHGDAATAAFLDAMHVGDCRQAGSSLKFCRLAEGEADLYPRFGPTMEWDIAAGDAILRAAGGITLAPGGAPMRYGKVAAGHKNTRFLALGDRSLAANCVF